MNGFDVEWLGTVPYDEGLALQREAVEARLRGDCADRLLLLEHPPVVTLGSSARPENLLVSERELEARGVALHRARRGGDVTFHAPGQLVGYLVVDLAERRARDVHAFLRGIEASLIGALGEAGVPARRIDGMTGVFVDEPGARGPDRKIASIGIGVRRWVTYHGFALNVGLDLRGFDVIVPCGLADVEMTSVARELSVGAGALPALEAGVRSQVADAFRRTFAGRAGPRAAQAAPAP